MVTDTTGYGTTKGTAVVERASTGQKEYYQDGKLVQVVSQSGSIAEPKVYVSSSKGAGDVGFVKGAREPAPVGYTPKSVETQKQPVVEQPKQVTQPQSSKENIFISPLLTPALYSVINPQRKEQLFIPEARRVSQSETTTDLSKLKPSIPEISLTPREQLRRQKEQEVFIPTPEGKISEYKQPGFIERLQSGEQTFEKSLTSTFFGGLGYSTGEALKSESKAEQLGALTGTIGNIATLGEAGSVKKISSGVAETLTQYTPRIATGGKLVVEGLSKPQVAYPLLGLYGLSEGQRLYNVGTSEGSLGVSRELLQQGRIFTQLKGATEGFNVGIQKGIGKVYEAELGNQLVLKEPMLPEALKRDLSIDIYGRPVESFQSVGIQKGNPQTLTQSQKITELRLGQPELIIPDSSINAIEIKGLRTTNILTGNKPSTIDVLNRLPTQINIRSAVISQQINKVVPKGLFESTINAEGIYLKQTPESLSSFKISKEEDVITFRKNILENTFKKAPSIVLEKQLGTIKGISYETPYQEYGLTPYKKAKANNFKDLLTGQGKLDIVSKPTINLLEYKPLPVEKRIFFFEGVSIKPKEFIKTEIKLKNPSPIEKEVVSGQGTIQILKTEQIVEPLINKPEVIKTETLVKQEQKKTSEKTKTESKEDLFNQIRKVYAKPKIKLYEETIIQPREIVKVRDITSQVQFIKSKSVQSIKPISKQAQIITPTIKPTQSSLQESIPKQKQLQSQSQIPVQKPEQLQKQINEFKNINDNVLKNVFRFKEPVLEKPRIGLPLLPNLKQSKFEKLFDVEIGRKGKTKIYEFKKGLTFEQAQSYLKSKLKGTLAASGSIQYQGKKLNLGNIGEEFYTSQRTGSLVQKRKFRLSSGEEKRQIQQYRGGVAL